jgi:hypothetical protein
MPETSPELRTLQAQVAAHESWGRTRDRSARTANARRAFEDRFLAEADGDPQRAESLRKAYFGRLALKSAKARRLRNGDRRTVVESRITELDGGGDDAA